MICCEMKGFLTYLILWNLNKGSMTGAELAKELERRKGIRPSPGTIYPALKQLNGMGLISAGKNKAYSLTNKGKKELKTACGIFCGIFYDAGEMIRFRGKG